MSDNMLVVGPSWVGDMVMAQVLFKRLKAKLPDCNIDVLAPAWTEPLLARMPEVRRGIAMPVGHGELHLGQRRRLGKTLAHENYAQAIVLPNSLKSALVPWFANIPRRTGWLGEMRYGLLNDYRKLDKQAYPLMIQRFAALAEKKGTPAMAKEKLPWPELVVNDAQRNQALQKYKLDVDAPILALCPGAEFGPAKRWPEQHYAQVASHYLSKGWQVWLMGSANDFDVCAAIDVQTEQVCHNLAGKTTLAEAIDLLSLASQVVCNDSGLMHVAAALGRKLVVPYGSTSTEFTPPLSNQAITLRLGLDCSPCFKRECPLQHLDCLRKLEPQRVIDAIEQLQAQAT